MTAAHVLLPTTVTLLLTSQLQGCNMWKPQRRCVCVCVHDGYIMRSVINTSCTVVGCGECMCYYGICRTLPVTIVDPYLFLLSCVSLNVKWNHKTDICGTIWAVNAVWGQLNPLEGGRGGRKLISSDFVESLRNIECVYWVSQSIKCMHSGEYRGVLPNMIM